jgi:hypothetical protein
MSIFSLRAPLRQYCSHLNREQRRSWMTQRMRLTPKVNISGAYVPPSVARQYKHVEWLRGAG